MNKKVEQLLLKEKKDRTGTLDLGNCGLKEIPDLAEFDWLVQLNLSTYWYDEGKRRFIKSQNSGTENRIAKVSSS